MKFHNIQILYLSNNRLKDLSGIEQFPNIVTLSLAHNEVKKQKINPKFLKSYLTHFLKNYSNISKFLLRLMISLLLDHYNNYNLFRI